MATPLLWVAAAAMCSGTRASVMRPRHRCALPSPLPPRAPRSHVDDEYAHAGEADPKVLITTSRDPSSRLTQFAKVSGSRAESPADAVCVCVGLGVRVCRNFLGPALGAPHAVRKGEAPLALEPTSEAVGPVYICTAAMCSMLGGLCGALAVLHGERVLPPEPHSGRHCTACSDTFPRASHPMATSIRPAASPPPTRSADFVCLSTA